MSTTTFGSLHTTQQLVKEALSNTNEWQTIDGLVAICNEAGCWGTGFAQRAIANAKKSQIRKVVCRLKDKDGFPLFPSITIADTRSLSATFTLALVTQKEFVPSAHIDGSGGMMKQLARSERLITGF